MYKKILIPLDNSPTDSVILDHIQPLARLTGASLVLVHVADGYVARLQDELNLQDSEEIKNDRLYLNRKKAELVKNGFNVSAYLVGGEPTTEILAIAAKERCDLIAMSTHGHKLIKDAILGSVAEAIRHRTNIPVLMIRAAKEQEK